MENRPTVLALGANKPFFLDRNDHFWVVASGEVDLYYVKRTPENKLESSRNYLYTAKKGEILFSLKTGTTFNEFSLIAVSPNSKLIEVHKSYIGSLNKTQLTTKIEKWVSALSTFVHQENRPKVYHDLDKVGIVTLGKNEIAYPSKGLFWANINEGSISIYGEKDLVETDTYSKKILLPVTKELWIRSQDDKTEVELFETATILNDDITLMISIHHLQDYFFNELKEKFYSKIEKEEDIISQKTNSDKKAIQDSLSGLKSIIFSKNEQQVFSNINSTNHLLAACQLVGRSVGFKFVEPKFIRDYEHNLTGQLDAIAQVSNVRTRKVILRGRWWEEENGSLLAFTRDDKKPVALIQESSGSYFIQRPENKTKEKVTDIIAKNLEPISYMFLYAFDEQMTSISKIGKFAIKGLKVDAVYIMLAALVGSLIGLLVPIFSGILFDDVIPQADRGFLLEVVGIMLIIGLVKALLNLTKGILLLRVETKSNISIQAGLIDHLLRLPVTFYRKYTAGDLTLRALGINSIRRILSNTILTAVLSGAFSIVNLMLLFYYDSSLAWIGIGLAIVAIVVVSSLGFLKLKYDRRISDEQGSMQGFLFEFLSGINKVRVSGAENRIFSLWANKFSDYKTLGFKSGNYQNFVEVFNASYPLLTSIFFFSFIYITLMNAGSTGNGLISVGIFMAFISAFNQFLGDCLNMSMSLISSLNIIPLYERLKPILEEKPESAVESLDPGELSGELEFNSVSFRYEEDQPLVLKDVSFKIKQGEMVAFVGPSGSGKSTVLRLLLGFEEAELGTVYYDGQAFDSLNKDLVRRQVGVVLQNGSLMSGSIYQNIVGSSELTLEDAEEAANLAGLEEDIKQMPMGMHTVISEGASTFSGGQRQRLMIARSIVHKPRMLYMDEATSALDNRTQNIVSESLEKLQATRIIIAHRLSTIINADRIFVMDKGQIVESGTYDELMENDGLFSLLAKRQIA
ncbi:MAG: NHLP bacteriocin export ABC transporter permease/ATPase subunit [Saprospiraceae bacterium]